MKTRLRFVVYGAIFIAVAGLAAPLVGLRADDTSAKDGVDAKVAFKKLKTLVGSWTCKISDEHKDAAAKEKEAAKGKEHDEVKNKDHEEDHPSESPVTYKLTGAGSALVETQFPGMGHEMVSVYHLDGPELRMTHYCAAGNQPRVKLDRAKSTPDDLVFVFDGGTNLDPEKDMHIHGVRIKFEKDGRVVSAWDGYANGKKVSTTTFEMTKK